MNRRLEEPSIGLPSGRRAARAALVASIANAGLLVLKISVGIMSGSIAVLSDGIDSAEDLVASILALVSIRLADRPADESHPYGHGKAEHLAALAESLFIGVGGILVLYQAVQRLLIGEYEITAGVGIAAMAFTAVVNIGLSFYVRAVAEESGSPALRANVRHLRTNVVQAIAVIAGLTLVAVTGRHWFDSIVAFGLALYILRTAALILFESAGQLLDRRLDDGEITLIRKVLDSLPGEVIEYHDLRTRRAGRLRYVDLHVVVSAESRVDVAHAFTEQIEREIAAVLPDTEVTVHIEPHQPPDDTSARG